MLEKLLDKLLKKDISGKNGEEVIPSNRAALETKTNVDEIVSLNDVTSRGEVKNQIALAQLQEIRDELNKVIKLFVDEIFNKGLDGLTVISTSRTQRELKVEGDQLLIKRYPEVGEVTEYKQKISDFLNLEYVNIKEIINKDGELLYSKENDVMAYL